MKGHVMRKFVCRGEKNDGRVLNIKHGKRVYVVSTQEHYIVQKEPHGSVHGVLVLNPETKE